MKPTRIEASAPTRIDLAGGTIDIWPLYLLHERPLTVNAAIDRPARVVVETMDGTGLEVISRDRHSRFRADAPAGPGDVIAAAPAELELVARLAAHFLYADERSGEAGRRRGCRITTDCRVPAGSGLGGSSALGIALAGALSRFVGRKLSPEALLSLTRAVETQTLRIPTGEQDYHPALHGGPLALHYTVEGTRVERLNVDPAALYRRTVLIYSGTTRSSGLSNWDMLKRHLDGDREVRDAMTRVNRATHDLRAAMLRGDLDAVGAALSDEWTARKRLSPAVTDEVIDRFIQAAVDAGALAGKVCGAGGGGCVVLWVREGKRQMVADRLAADGAEILDFSYAATGLEITET